MKTVLIFLLILIFVACEHLEVRLCKIIFFFTTLLTNSILLPIISLITYYKGMSE